LNGIVKLKSLLNTDLARVSFLNGLSTVVKMMTGLVSIKVISVIIGPSGVALLGQLTNFSAILLIVANGGINSGITKYLSEHSEERDKYNLYLGTGFWITMVFSVVTGLVLFVGAGYFSRIILNDEKYTLVFYIFGGTIIFYALNALLVSVINGFKDYTRYLQASLLGSFTGLAFTVTLSVKFGIMGALISSITFQSIVFLLTLYITRNASWFNVKSFIKLYDKATAVKLSHYAVMALVSAITVPGSQLFVRGYITKVQSIHEAGLWEGINRISIMYLFVIMTSLSVYYLPRLAELKTKYEIRREIFSVYRLMIPFLLICITIIYAGRDIIIHLLFTHEFNGMHNLFGFQLVGDVLKMCGWVLGYVLIAKAMTRVYIFMEVLNFFNSVVLGIFFIDKFGTYGATISYALVHTIYLITMLVILRKIIFVKKPKTIT
jgi:O-antigen/teichoic acid export membrane protein